MPMNPIPQCEHIKADGIRCGSPAMRDSHQCYHHSRQLVRRMSPMEAAIRDPRLQNAALSDIIRDLVDHRIDAKTAGVMLYCLQLAGRR